MSYIVDFMKQVEEGRKGHNIGLSTGIEKLDSVIYGVQRSNITTIAGASGSGNKNNKNLIL